VALNFLATFLQGKGELWIGGIASLAIILVSVMAYVFAISFMNQYPAEITDPLNFACDTSLRNAKFDTKIQAKVVPICANEQTIFEMLDAQIFTLNLDFLSTKLTCRELAIEHLINGMVESLQQRSCVYSSGVLSVSIDMPDHAAKVRIVFDEMQLIGGVRIGLNGSRQQQGMNTVQELNFRRSFYSTEKRTLAPYASIHIDITKVVAACIDPNSLDMFWSF
jgi:hypothetical protein